MDVRNWRATAEAWPMRYPEIAVLDSDELASLNPEDGMGYAP